MFTVTALFHLGVCGYRTILAGEDGIGKSFHNEKVTSDALTRWGLMAGDKAVSKVDTGLTSGRVGG